MIVHYAHGCPNPHKVSIALEELGLPHRHEIVEIWQGVGTAPEFLAVSPNGKVPVIVDEEAGLTIYESNAILLYLADKAGRLVPAAGAERWRAIQLLFFQASSIGPMYGQRAHFALFNRDRSAYASERYVAEAARLTSVLDRLLEGRDWFLDDYSIVDIAHFGWLWCGLHHGFGYDDYPNVRRWFDRVAARPAVQRGVALPLPLPDFSGLRAA